MASCQWSKFQPEAEVGPVAITDDDDRCDYKNEQIESHGGGLLVEIVTIN